MEGILITILMFAVPIMAAVIDKKLKAGRKAQPQVHAEPVIFEDDEEEKPERAIVREAYDDPWKDEDEPELQPEPETRPAATQPVMTQPATMPATPQAAAAAPAAPVVPTAPKTTHAKPSRKSAKRTHSEAYPTAEEIRHDRRKLILYKEIMTPKFDSE